MRALIASALLFCLGCGEDTGGLLGEQGIADGGGEDAAAQRADDAHVGDSSRDDAYRPDDAEAEDATGGGLADAAPTLPDAGTIDLDAGTTVVVIQPISGTPSPTLSPLHGPGLILMGGGTDVDAAFVWMHDTLAGSTTDKIGNVVVLRSDVATDNAYTPYIYGLAPFQSVMSIYLGGTAAHGGPATAADLAIAGALIDRADAVFFAGGDQADYVSWKGSPVTSAITRLFARGGVIGGTSAGCAVLGPFVFDSVAADQAGNLSVATSDAVADPFEAAISFTRGALAFPTLPNVITDMHFVTRDRLGRLAAFVARQYADGAATTGVLGIGVDESNALLVDKSGKATLVQQPGGSQASAGSGAYVVQPSAPATRCTKGKALLYESLNVTRLASPANDSFDFAKKCGVGDQFTLTVDGTHPTGPYAPSSPYTAKGVRSTCP